jgi:phage terminase large subunit-like protein
MSPPKKKQTRRTSSSSDPVTAYAEAVICGKEVAGPHVRAACERHMRDLADGHKRGLHFDREAADRALRFFPAVLRLSDGQFEDKPFDLHPSQAFKTGSVFGWKRADGTRRFRRAYLEEGKGNGKSPWAAGVGLLGMAADGEPGAQIYAAGARKEQAYVLYNDAVKMARKAPALAKKITFSGQNPVWNMAMLGAPQAGAFFRPVSREAGRSGSGPRPHFALIDELHEHPDRTVMDMLERGFKFRRQPLLLMITNSGSDRNSVCYEEHQHAIKVAHGDKQDDATFSYVCALDEGDDPLNDPTCWKKANPLLGTILTEDYLAGVVAQAKAIPGKQNGILRLHFCIWTDADKAWISRQAWEACEDPALNIEDFAGRRAWAGLDLSATKDLTGKALVFEDGITEDGKPKFVALAHGYTPKDTLLQRAENDKADYHVWEREGFLTATPGPVVRYDYVAQDLVTDQQDYDLQAVAYDRYLIKHFEEAVSELGAVLPLIEHGQGLGQRKGCEPDCNKPHKHEPAPLWMPQSVTEFENMILEKRIRIQVNPALRSAVASACFWTSPAGLRRFEKQKATGRIDLVIALVMAAGAAVAGSGVKPREYQMFFVG